MTDEEMRAVVEEAARHDLKVAAHAHGTEGIKAAIRAGVASIEHGSPLDRKAGSRYCSSSCFDGIHLPRGSVADTAKAKVDSRVGRIAQ